MYKYLYLLSLILSLLISIKSSSIQSLIISTVQYSVVIFVIIALYTKNLVSIRKNFKNHNISAMFFNLAIVCFITVILFFVYRITFSCSPGSKSSYFRTNIITGKCEYGGGGPCIHSDPDTWYYEEGCSTEEAKINALKNDEYFDYDKSVAECNSLCGDKGAGDYCTHLTPFIRYVEDPNYPNCELITDCKTIKCGN